MAQKISNKIIEQEEEKKEEKKLSYFLAGNGVQQSLRNSLGTQEAVTKFTSSILSAVSVNPKLQECSFPTIVSAGLIANSLNLPLSPSLGYAYIVPFEDKNNKRTVATFILGYKGMLQLAMRSNYYKKINVLDIREGELISCNRFEEDYVLSFIEDDDIREKTPVIGYIAMFEYLNGFRKTIYWSKEKMLHHADRYSKAFSLDGTGGKFPKVSYADYCAGKVPPSEMWKYSSYWYSDFDGMAKKTMLRQLFKWGIMSIDMANAFEADEHREEEHEAYDMSLAATETDNKAADDFFGDEENAESQGEITE